MKVILQALVASALLATPAFAAGDLSTDRANIRQPDHASTSADRKMVPTAKAPLAADQNAGMPSAPSTANDLSSDRAQIRQPDEASTSADRKMVPEARSPYAAEQNAQVPIAPQIQNGSGVNQDGESSQGVRSVDPATTTQGP